MKDIILLGKFGDITYLARDSKCQQEMTTPEHISSETSNSAMKARV